MIKLENQSLYQVSICITKKDKMNFLLFLLATVKYLLFCGVENSRTPACNLENLPSVGHFSSIHDAKVHKKQSTVHSLH